MDEAKNFVEKLLSEYPEPKVQSGLDEVYHKVYLTYHKDSYKFYIGKHSTVDPLDGYIGSGAYLFNAIKKHGREAFICRPLKYLISQEEAYDLEKELVTEEFIKVYRDTLGVCYNLKSGGKGGDTLSKATRDKLGLNSKKMLSPDKAEMSIPNSQVLEKLNLGWTLEQNAYLYHKDTLHIARIHYKVRGKKTSVLSDQVRKHLIRGFVFGTTKETWEMLSEEKKDWGLYYEIEGFLDELKGKKMKDIEDTEVVVPANDVLSKLNLGWTFEQYVKLFHPETYHYKQIPLMTKRGRNPYLEDQLRACLERGFHFAEPRNKREKQKDSPLFNDIESFLKKINQNVKANKPL